MVALSAQACLRWYQAMGVTDPVGLAPINRLAPAPTVTPAKATVAERVLYQSAAASSAVELSNLPPTLPDVPADLPNLAAFNTWLASAAHTHSLAKTAQQAVLGAGAQNPQIVFVAEAPDRAEDQSGQAWQIPELQWLQKAWALAAPHMAEHTYYMYLSPWRPPGQRPLTTDELAYCQKLLHQQLQWLNPSHVLCLGPNVAKTLTNTAIKNNDKQWLNANLLDKMPDLRLAPLPTAKNVLMSAISKKAAWQQLLQLTHLL